MNGMTGNTNFQVMWLGGRLGGCEGGMMLQTMEAKMERMGGDEGGDDRWGLLMAY